MIQKSTFFLQSCINIFIVSCNLLQPDYSVKVLNTENIILGDIDLDDDDLEVINKHSENPQINEKMKEFHSYVSKIQVTETPETFFYVFHHEPANKILKPEKPFGFKKNKFKRNKKHKWRAHLKRKNNNSKNKIIHKREITNDNYEDSENETERNLDEEYEIYLEGSKRNKTVFKYSDEGKPEENLKDIIHKITDVKTPKNCTNVQGIGVQALECIIKEAEAKEISKKQVVKQVFGILLIWFCIYIVIAIPLWCSKGWCCCCFRCAFCYPERTIKEIEKFLAENPPGVFTDERGNKEEYNPTAEEVELYEKLKKSITNF